jgi:hypothetical protein
LVEAAQGCILLLEEHVKGLVWRFSRRGEASKSGIVPLERLRGKPLRFACVSGILDDDSHAMVPVVIREIAHDPHSRMLHFDDRGNALRGPDPKARNLYRLRQRVAIHCNDGEAVAR